MAQLRQSKALFDKAEARVVLVGMGSIEETSEFIATQAVPFQMVCDPKQRLYRAYDLNRMSLLSALNPTVAVKGVSAMARGHGIGLPKGDIRQPPGVFVIDTDGAVVFSHFGADPADHPTPEEILANL